MITIIHGDDIVSSRKHFLFEREKSQNSLVLDGEKISLTDLIQTFEGSLFGSQKTIFIENFFERRGKEYVDIVNYLKRQKTGDITLWEGKGLSKTSLSVFSKVNVVLFALPKVLFLFLDSIRPGNGSQLVVAFHKLIKGTEPELVFYMIVREFRLLLALSSQLSDRKTEQQIDEVLRMLPWQREKLGRQARLFSLDRLKEIYGKLYEIDLNQKTGNTSLSLVQNIDIFLLDL